MKRELRSALAPDLSRFLAAAIVASIVVTLVAAAAGVARILPTLLDPAVPARAARPFLAGLLALSLEVGALVGWPLGWTEAAVRSRERGEARARMALGEAPWRRLMRLSPTIALLSLLAAAGSVAWGRDARGPGRVARALLEEGRRSCLGAISRGETRVIAVPLVRTAWLCRAGHEPLLVGEGAGSAAPIDFAASSLIISDDLTSFVARDAQILVPSETPLRIVVGEARILGLHPFSAPSSVPPFVRAATLVTAALLSALLSTASALRGEARVRAAAWGIALAGPSATLVVLRACEQAQIADVRLIAIPLSAVAATLLARLVARVAAELLRRRPRRSPQRSTRA